MLTSCCNTPVGIDAIDSAKVPKPARECWLVAKFVLEKIMAATKLVKAVPESLTDSQRKEILSDSEDVVSALMTGFDYLLTEEQAPTLAQGWQWGSQQRKAFRHVKGLLKSNRVLTHYNDQLPLLLECDASPYGLGAILSHRMPDGSEKPVGFASRTLSKAECNYSHLDKEALAIIFGVKKYHQYLYGRHFEIKTDHKPLTHLPHQPELVMNAEDYQP